MTYYAHINTEYNSIGKGECPVSGENIVCIEITEEVYNNIDHYIYNGEELILDPDYEEKQAQKERERIGELQITKRVFMLGLQQLGITYTQLKTLLATNEQAQMEWDLCVELQRKNPLLDVMASQFGVTSEMLDYIFRKANGEDVQNAV